MDFTMTDEQLALQDAVRGTAKRFAGGEGGEDTTAAPRPYDPVAWRALVDLGLPSLIIPEQSGGMGGSVSDLAIAAEELGRAGVRTPLADVVAASAILSASDCETAQRVCAAVSDGTALPVLALDEPMRAWCAAATVRAERLDGDQGWSLTGVKAPAPYCGDATHLIVTATTDDGTDVLFLVGDLRPDAPGRFDGTAATLLGQGDAATSLLDDALALGGVVLSAEAVGIMSAALAMTCDYLRTRRQFGVPLSTFQVLQHRCADMYVQLELARSSVLYAAMAADEEEPYADIVRRARVVVDGASELIGRETIQMHGGMGVAAAYPAGHCTARLEAIRRTWGSHDDHVRVLATRIADHGCLDVLG